MNSERIVLVKQVNPDFGNASAEVGVFYFTTMKAEIKSELFSELLGLRLSPQAFALLMFIVKEKSEEQIYRPSFFCDKDKVFLLTTIFDISYEEVESAFDELIDKKVLCFNSLDDSDYLIIWHDFFHYYG